VYAAPGCFAHPKSRAFWLGGASGAGRVSRRGASPGAAGRGWSSVQARLQVGSRSASEHRATRGRESQRCRDAEDARWTVFAGGPHRTGGTGPQVIK